MRKLYKVVSVKKLLKMFYKGKIKSAYGYQWQYLMNY